jgi:hypothetical protein
MYVYLYVCVSIYLYVLPSKSPPETQSSQNCTSTTVCMYACICVCMYVCMYVCVCVYTLSEHSRAKVLLRNRAARTAGLRLNVCMYVYVYDCVFVCGCVCVCMCPPTSKSTREEQGQTCRITAVCMYACMCMYRMHVCMYACMYVCVSIHVCSQMYVCMHTEHIRTAQCFDCVHAAKICAVAPQTLTYSIYVILNEFALIARSRYHRITFLPSQAYFL